jgi:hypothetical protein
VEAMVWIGIEQSRTPSAKVAVVNAVLFHVTAKFPTQECGRSTWMMVHDLLVRVVHYVSALVWKFIPKPGC